MPMKALQLHYTSCRRGQSGNAGFQTRTLTEGIRPDEQREVERRGVYRPPRDARQDPSSEEINREFPCAFRCYTLESGRPAITRSSYVGRDYSGRWGNFFAHSLVFENGRFPVLWPIDLYEWDGWKDGLAPEEDGEETPPLLPPADLADVPSAESFRVEELRDFLQEEPGRCDLLARMGRAVLLGRETSRAVVIRDTPVQGLYWIACLQKLFPPQHAAALTSSTYQDDPRGCAAINATTGETDFTFDEAERRFRFYEFDLTTGTHSEVPESADDYPAVAARWMTEDPGRLQRFYEFLRLFAHRELEPALISAIHLFDLAQGEGAAPGGERLTQMIGFASHHATAEGRVRLLEVLGRAADLAGGLPRAEDYDSLIRFLAGGARATGRPEHRALALRAWLSLARYHLLAGGQGLSTVEGTWEHLWRELGVHGSELAGLVLAEPLWSDPRVPQLPSPAMAFLLRAAWRCLDHARRVPAWEQPEVHTLLAALGGQEVTAAAPAALAAIPPAPEPLVAVSRRLRDAFAAAGKDAQAAARGVGGALGGVLAGIEPKTSAAVRRHLEAAEEWDLLLGEWFRLLEMATDPLGAFDSYRRGILAALARYEETCLPAVVSALLQRLSVPQRSAVALEWLRRGEIDGYPPKLAETCIALANLAVPLDPGNKEGQETAKLVAEAARSRRIQLRPDRPLLQEVWAAVRAPKGSLAGLRLKEIRDSVAALPAADHANFAEGFLAGALERAANKGEHQQILTATAGGRPALVAKPYLGFFKAKRKTAWPESLQAALRFWLAFDGRDESTLAKLEETARQGFLHALKQLEPSDLAKIDSKLRLARIDGRAETRWREIQEALAKRRSRPWNRLFRVFGRS
jgi:hypothetical protein